MHSIDDTIVAIATPLGEGGIAVIRISGKQSIEVADKRFIGKTKLQHAKTHTAHFGKFVGEDGGILDDVVITIFCEPNSYTGEDVIEISCHGGVYIAKTILSAIMSLGIRMAEPGEFTKRAFLNGRIDLAQAEAVADLIKSRSEISRRTALNQLHGTLSDIINKIRNRLLDFCCLLELELDFSEEKLEFINRDNLLKEIKIIIRLVSELQSTYNSNRIIREGVRVVLIGRPNVGKSSIFNCLLRENRAIVTPISGTTRDTIVENLLIKDFLFVISDTAGLWESNNPIEIEGINRTRDETKKADIIIFVIDVLEEIISSNTNKLIIKKILENKKPYQTVLFVVNKVDLIPEHIGTRKNELFKKAILISAKTEKGIDKLKGTLVEIVRKIYFSEPERSMMMLNNRHYNNLKNTMESLTRANDSILMGMSSEIIAIDIRDAINSISEITGVITTDDVLNNIFTKFCIGK